MFSPKKNKRVNFPRFFERDKAFMKDWNRLSCSGRYDMRRLREAMMFLVDNDESFGAEWADHALKGQWSSFRECHIGCDFLMIYKVEIEQSSEIAYFTRAGTHAELFE